MATHLRVFAATPELDAVYRALSAAALPWLPPKAPTLLLGAPLGLIVGQSVPLTNCA